MHVDHGRYYGEGVRRARHKKVNRNLLHRRGGGYGDGGGAQADLAGGEDGVGGGGEGGKYGSYGAAGSESNNVESDALAEQLHAEDVARTVRALRGTLESSRAWERDGKARIMGKVEMLLDELHEGQ